MSTMDPEKLLHRFGVIVVDDDSTSREFHRVVLEQFGYDVVATDGVAAAKAAMLSAGFDAFDCVLTDYHMPELTGLDLLAWLKINAPDLATIIFTAAGEKKLVADSLRGGATDFLEKPVNAIQLRDSVNKAVALTHQQRRAAQVESAVKDLGRAQQRMIHTQPAGADLGVELCFHPKLEAGGDAFSHFQTGPDHHFCLLTDVRGHDLQAAYLSAYFQGFVRGMVECGAPVSDIFRLFNKYLAEEWSRSSSFAVGNSNRESVGACVIAIDLQSGTANVLTCGVPSPLLVAADGRASHLGAPGGVVLGAFPDFSGQPASQPIAGNEMCVLRTDGIEDLAAKLKVDPLSLLYRLHATNDQPDIAELREAEDDILSAIICLPGGGMRPVSFYPLILGQYSGDGAATLDELGQYWRRSLQLALPELPETIQCDLLRASREAVRECVCQGGAGSAVQDHFYQLSVQPEARTVRIWVENTRPGQPGSPATCAPSNSETMVEEGQGMALINRLAKSVKLDRQRASLRMDFAF